MSAPRQWLLAGVLVALVGSLVGCVQPAPQYMNGYYYQSPPRSGHRHRKPTPATASRRAVPSSQQAAPASQAGEPPTAPTMESQQLPASQSVVPVSEKRSPPPSD